MGNMLSYINEFGGFNFVEKPLGEVDGLIFSHLAYYVYDGIVPGMGEGKAPVFMKDIPELIDDKNFISVCWEMEENRKILDLIMRSRRYRNTRMCCYVNEIDEEKDLQFSAVTFLLGNGDIFISFRGTDDNVVGWREDFCMAYRTPVLAQIRSVEYVNYVADFFRKKRNVRLYLGGHSKGGNLAVYAAMNCNETIKRNIGRVYNMDGPGFRPDFMEQMDYEGIKDKIIKIVPQDSFVGMLMETSKDYVLIESYEVGVQQHIPLSWRVNCDAFVRIDDFQQPREKLYENINNWIFNMDREQVGNFLDSLFKLVEITEIRTLSEVKSLSSDFSKKIHSMTASYMKFDSETKQIFWEMALFLAEVVARDQHERIGNWKMLEKIRAKIEEKK
ncbi:MAG: DUF2974 domain-containing protein [Lachnospiraceae bacterium]|nr:DUF2974 domain-containing protein [Lachnospiraceae bacterium]